MAFRHELARVAVEEALPPDRRLRLHRRALAALAGNADPARLAYHAEGAGDGDAVLRYAPRRRRAGRRGRRPPRGRRRSTPAPCASPARCRRRTRAELHERRSHQCYVADRPTEAAEDLRLALACHRELGDRRGEGDALRALSSILWCPGLADEAERAGREAVALLEPLGPGRELADGLREHGVAGHEPRGRRAAPPTGARGRSRWPASSATRRSRSTR